MKFVFEDNCYQLKASIGSAIMPIDGIELEKILEIADQCMYSLKQLRKSILKNSSKI